MKHVLLKSGKYLKDSSRYSHATQIEYLTKFEWPA